jgi:four helix bundle protein
MRRKCGKNCGRPSVSRNDGSQVKNKHSKSRAVGRAAASESQGRRTFRFERIEAWQMARQLNREIYLLSRKFSKDETFGLTSQIRRASVSVSSNIAEGSGRNSDADFAHFLEIAYGSLMETTSQLFLAFDQQYITEQELDNLLQTADLLAGKIVALSKSLGRASRIFKPSTPVSRPSTQ